MMAEKKPKKNKYPVLWIIAGVLAVTGLLIALLFVKGRMDMTSTGDVTVEAPKELQVAAENNGRVVHYEDRTYYLNENITNILCIGVDKHTLELQEQVGYGGQADSLFLAVLDSKNHTVSIIGLSRDSMTEVDVYDVEGNYVETVTEQLCLSYAYGDGMETSCENTVNSVSRMLYGIPIHGYVAIDMDCVSEINDLLGGVTIYPTEQDKKWFDFAMNKESVLLKGNEAELYIRFRDTDLLDSNNDRIRRQKTYLLAFIQKALAETKADLTMPVRLLQKVEGDVVTNLSVSDISYLASQVINCEISMDDLTVVQGEIREEEGHAALYPDEQALYELVLKTFYYQ